MVVAEQLSSISTETKIKNNLVKLAPKNALEADIYSTPEYHSADNYSIPRDL
jgi:hypothetical protein